MKDILLCCTLKRTDSSQGTDYAIGLHGNEGSSLWIGQSVRPNIVCKCDLSCVRRAKAFWGGLQRVQTEILVPLQVRTNTSIVVWYLYDLESHADEKVTQENPWSHLLTRSVRVRLCGRPQRDTRSCDGRIGRRDTEKRRKCGGFVASDEALVTQGISRLAER